MTESILKIETEGAIATLTMNRPEKRNAMCDALLEALDTFFSAPPSGVKVVILTGTAGHYCSGLDLSEHVHRTAEENLYHSRRWHGVMDKIQYGGLVVVSAMFGAVIGGGLELAASTHVRIAGRLLGADRMTEMMLTGRKYGHTEGQQLGLAHYAVEEGESLALAQKLAGKISRNAPMSNYLMVQSISRIHDMPQEVGLYAESLAAALSQTTPDAEEGLRAFLDKRAPNFR